MIAALLASLALSQSAPVETLNQPPVDLSEVVIEGRRLEDLTEDFVREVAAPSAGRGLARWRDGVCVGVVNLRAEHAQYIADRVSTVAEDMGLRAGQPGCHPSIVIVAATDANAFTEEFIDMRPRLFRVGGSGMDRGRAAFERFRTTERPVRWWVVSAPVDDDTGQVAVRIFGHVRGNGGSVMDYAPQIRVRNVSNLSTQIVNDTKRAFIIVDVDRIQDVSLTQLADYIAMVALAQIDPDADTSAYRSVLNLFEDPEQTPGLTQWDLAYLEGLYSAQRTNRHLATNAREITSSIMRAHRTLISEDQDAAPE